MRSLLLSFLLIVVCLHLALGGTTGKIVGTVTDARTGERLISANVVVVGRNLGAATNVEGYYVILNVPPGKHTLRASLLGYRGVTTVDVVVEIDQTTTLPFRLTEEAMQGEEITIVAERPVVQRDLSSSRANITSVEVERLPTASVATVIAQQAGVQQNADGQLIIRGGGADQTVFLLNGQSLRDARDNTSFTQISLSSIENLQVTTGGFDAQYGNVRSGLVNAVTKEGSTSQYTFTVSGRYRPPRPKHFGPSIYDRNSYWIRPFVDPDVCWTGTTNGKWDEFTQRQYQQFEGWNSVAQKTLSDTDPTNDLTPEAAQRLFLWQHRRQVQVSEPDYDVDAGFGGPVPFGEYLGNLRFFGAYRQSQSMYVLPLSRDGLQDYVGQLKITSDIASNMKLTLEGLLGRTQGTNDNNSGLGGAFTSSGSIISQMDRVSYIDARIFATDYWAPTIIRRKMVGAKLSHVLSQETFYSVSLHRYETRYNTGPGRPRNNARIYKFGNAYYVDEAPYGFQLSPLQDPSYKSDAGIGSGMRMAVGMSNSRDNTIIATYNVRGDITSQIDRHNQMQAGFEFVYTDNDVSYSSVDPNLPSGRSSSVWRTFPIQGALYAQDKLEYEGMVANLGVRVDYSHAGGLWYEYDPFSKYLSGTRTFLIDSVFQKNPTKKLVTLSPRLGVAFPITDNSKLFFNYGHFRSLPAPENLFLVRRDALSGSILRLADPNNPLPKTVSYELGYEQSLLDQFLIRVTGYYKDVTDETKLVRYVNKSSTVSYSVSTSNLYEDIRGLEVSVEKNRGDWLRGFVNYTYDVRTSGFFGLENYYEDRVLAANEDKRNVSQSKPKPQPFGRLNLSFATPRDFGPSLGPISLLGDFQVNLLGAYAAGSYFTWGGGGGARPVSAIDNVKWKDYWGLDLRLVKNFAIDRINVQFFVDITNLLELKRMSQYGFVTGQDFDEYMKSLHLPEEVAGNLLSPKLGYTNFPGSDRPGDYRKEGVLFTPMVLIRDLNSIRTPAPSAIYYEISTGRYMRYKNNAWVPEDPAVVQQVLDDKAYIDMPNQESFIFLNPRNFFYGMKISFDL